jgi:capsular exopolysaccharide synthesis family protein
MSRIHEALKKAEEERAAAQGGQPGSGGGPLAVEQGVAVEGPPAMPSFTTPFTFDMLLARCAHCDWSPDTRTMLFFNAEEHLAGTEEFRTLRSRLYQIREKQPLKKVLVTSSLPKEGKSFVASNLAQVIARQHGRRVLLIDADLRAPRLHQLLGTSAGPGLADYLSGQSDEFAVMQRGLMENLFFIPSGRTVSSPAELVANGRLKALLGRVEPLFDWIIIDSPPAVPVSDASLMADYCDGVLMVVRSNATPFDVAQKARQEFREERLIGVVLNGIDARSPAYSYYYKPYRSPDGKNGMQR